MSTDLRKMTGRLVNKARDGGALGFEVLLWRSTTTSLSSHAMHTAPLQESESKAHMRVYLAGGKEGVVTGDFEEETDLEGLLAKAVKAAGKAKPDDLSGPPDRIDITERGLGIHDPRQAGIEPSWREDVVSGNEAAARAVADNVIPGEFSYSEKTGERCYMSTRGVEAVETSTLYKLRGSVRLMDRPDVDIASEVVSRHFADVASVPLGTELARRAGALERTARLPDDPLPVIMEPRAVGKLLPRLAFAFDHAAVDAGKSFVAGKVGQAIGSDKLHVIDDATMPGALATRAFDDRGISPIPLPLIREGKASSLYLEPYRARKMNTRPTGHVYLDGGTWPGNLVVRPGSRSRNMIHSDLGPYIVVEDIVNTAGIDHVTGKVDVPVRLVLAEGGETIGYVGVRRIQCNVTDLFFQIVEMASDQERHGTVDACSWVLEGLTFV